MGHVLLINLVFFVPALGGSSAFAWTMLHIVRAPTPPSGESGGLGAAVGSRPPHPSAGPDDLARSA
jgi:hypothetical protein